MSRFTSFLVLPLFLTACTAGGDDTFTLLDPEVCDNGIDDNGNGLVDCDDASFCGGLVCRGDGGGGDTDTAVEQAPVEILFDESDCCDFSYGLQDCNEKRIGEFRVANRTDSEGLIDASCEVPQGAGTDEVVVKFRNNQAGSVRDFLVNSPIDAGSETLITVFYDCFYQETFQVSCQAEVEAEERSDTIRWTIEGVFIED